MVAIATGKEEMTTMEDAMKEETTTMEGVMTEETATPIVIEEMTTVATAEETVIVMAEEMMTEIMIAAVMLVRNGGQPVAKPRVTTGRFSIRTIVEPRVVPLSLSFMMFAIPYFVNQSFIVNYVQSRHLAVSSDLFFTFYAIALLVMRLTMRNLFDRKGFRFWMVVCSLSMIVTLATLTFMSNNWFLLFAGIFMAASYGLMSSVTQAQAVVIAGRERSGIANSTYYMGLDLGMALGPMLAGIFYGHLPISWFYPVFMLTMPLAWIIYLAFMRTIDGGRQAASN